MTDPLRTAFRALLGSSVVILTVGIAVVLATPESNSARRLAARRTEASALESSGRAQSPLAATTDVDQSQVRFRVLAASDVKDAKLQAALKSHAVSAAETESARLGQIELGPIVEVNEPQNDALERERRVDASRGGVLFHAVPYRASVEPGESSAVASRFATLQRQLDQLAEVQLKQQADGLHQSSQVLQQLQQLAQLQEIDRRLDRFLNEQSKKTADPASAAPPGPASTQPSPPASAPNESKDSHPADDKKTPIIKAEPDGSGDGDGETFSIQFQDAEVQEVLSSLGQLSGLNMLVGQGVTGRVPAASLENVTLDQALTAILRTFGFTYEKEGNIVYIMTKDDAERRKPERKLVTKVYRPHYISVKELQSLLVPILTDQIGIVAVTNPPEIGLAPSATEAGGDALAQSDALLVRDYAEKIQEVDLIVQELDVPPAQVVIEAMILSVKLTDELSLGVNFALLNGSNNQLLVSGNGNTLNSSTGFPGDGAATMGDIVPPMGQFVSDTLGLKYGFLRGDVSAFISALEKIADTNLIASPQLRVLNKQKAELHIGRKLGYKTVTNNGVESIENINFLDVGTKLFIRPYVGPDGSVRMEVHPERSGGEIVDGVPQADTTQVTTNVMVHDGSTIVIGGLIEEQSVESSERIPYLGSLPLVGHAFRNKSESTFRTELIVLITPRIVNLDEVEVSGDAARFEHEQRAKYFRNHLEPLNRSNLARIAFERAEDDFQHGKLLSARQHVNDSLRHSKNDAKSHRLRDEIERSIEERNRNKLNLRERWKRSNLLFPLRDKSKTDEPLPEEHMPHEPPPDEDMIVPVPAPEELGTTGG